MRKVIFTLSLTLFIFSLTLAQETQVKRDCQNLAGTLRDMDTDEVIPFAKIAIYQGATLIAGEDTNERGDYSFKNIKKGMYQIKASKIGYDFVDICKIEINACKTQYLDLDYTPSNNYISNLTVLDYKPRVKCRLISCYTNVTNDKCLPSPTKEVIPIDFNLNERNTPAPAEKDPDKPIKELSLYPNPSFGNITIELTFETLKIRLFDMLGHNLGQVPYQLLEEEKISIDLAYLPPSTYVLQLEHEEGVDIQKLIILDE